VFCVQLLIALKHLQSAPNLAGVLVSAMVRTSEVGYRRFGRVLLLGKFCTIPVLLLFFKADGGATARLANKFWSHLPSTPHGSTVHRDRFTQLLAAVFDVSEHVHNPLQQQVLVACALDAKDIRRACRLLARLHRLDAELVTHSVDVLGAEQIVAILRAHLSSFDSAVFAWRQQGSTLERTSMLLDPCDACTHVVMAACQCARKYASQCACEDPSAPQPSCLACAPLQVALDVCPTLVWLAADVTRRLALSRRSYSGHIGTKAGAGVDGVVGENGDSGHINAALGLAEGRAADDERVRSVGGDDDDDDDDDDDEDDNDDDDDGGTDGGDDDADADGDGDDEAEGGDGVGRTRRRPPQAGAARAHVPRMAGARQARGSAGPGTGPSSAQQLSVGMWNGCATFLGWGHTERRFPTLHQVLARIWRCAVEVGVVVGDAVLPQRLYMSTWPETPHIGRCRVSVDENVVVARQFATDMVAGFGWHSVRYLIQTASMRFSRDHTATIVVAVLGAIATAHCTLPISDELLRFVNDIIGNVIVRHDWVSKRANAYDCGYVLATAVWLDVNPRLAERVTMRL